MQRIERTKSQSRQRASTIADCTGGCYGHRRGFEPKPGSEATIFTRIALVLEIMGRRSHKFQCATMNGLENRNHGFRFSSDSLRRCVVKRTLETADIEVRDRRHVIIVLPAPATNELLSSQRIRL
ncbi:MAG: hypothetical protein QOI58_1536 [Thermoanaerobaculia bacterium]|nr:hypothetical protein [Thermoanaerobaculia bacterium]